MLIANVVDDVFLERKQGGAYNLYIRKRTSQTLMLVGTFYEEWHAIKIRCIFREWYGLRPEDLSKSDYFYQLPIKEKKIHEKIHQMNLRSRNKVVAGHERFQALCSKMKDKLSLENRATEILFQMDKRS